MRSKNLKRIGTGLLALAMVLSLFGGVTFQALARSVGNDGSAEMNEAYANQESLMPIGPSFNVATLLEWTPESDPDARYSRASIKLANREGGFVVNPKANPEAKLMLCGAPYSTHDKASAQGTADFFTYTFNYWQYVGSFVYWAGSEEGLVCCPTGEFTDAAHTNGVPVVATLGFPWGYGSNYVQQVKDFLQKAEDGSFPVADKLIEVMDYYGFDGYFFNQESYGCGAEEGALIDEMMRYMHKKRPDMLISWYDSMLPSGGVSYQNAVNSTNSSFMKDSEDGTRAIDEFFMNYNWYSGQITTTISTMESVGRSPFDAFAGFNVQANVYGDQLRDYLLVDHEGRTRISLALYFSSQTMSLAKDGEEFHKTELAYYVNAAGDPRVNDVDVSNSTVTEWAGMSRFFADKTVILSAPFVTNFTTGHGHGLWVDGVKSHTGDWSYQSTQDVLPTWTWIIDSEGEKLAGAYDFTDAYNGGNSIKLSGNLTANKANDIMLYSTIVKVTDGMKLSLTTKHNDGLLKLVAYYGDENTTSYEACEQVAYDLTKTEDSWGTTTVDISAKAGKTLYAIGLKAESASDVTGYQVNLGQLTITDKELSPLSAPKNVTLDEILYTDAFTAETRLFWDKVEGATSYEIYRVNADGSTTLLTETPNTAMYLAKIERAEGETDVTLKVVPIDANGQRGDGSTLALNWKYGDDDSEKVEIIETENVCLGATVTEYSEQGDGAECDKAIDGSLKTKWWASGAGDYMCIDLGRECTIRRWKIGHGGAGGEGEGMNHRSVSLFYKDSTGTWTLAKRIDNNYADYTDVLLDQPITAQEWKLVINQIGSSPWGAVNIYEWQMFESDKFPQTTPVPMQFATAVNNAGADDTFTLKNVPEGQTVKVYTKGADGSYSKIGEAVAGSSGIVTITGLDFGTAEAGCVYYTTTSSTADESAKLSAKFDAENAEKSEPATKFTFKKSLLEGSTTDTSTGTILGTVTVWDLEPGDVVYAMVDGTWKASLPVAAGQSFATVRGVLLEHDGGTLNMMIKRAGKLTSEAFTVETPKFATEQDKTALAELIAGVDANLESGAADDYTGASVDALIEALEAARKVLLDPSATVEQVNAAIPALQAAIDGLVKAGDGAALNGLLTVASEKLDSGKLTDESAQAIRTAMENAQNVIDARGTQEELDAAYAALDEAVKNAKEKPQPTDPDIPNTGDRMEIMLPLLAVVALSAMAAVVLLLKKRRTV